MNTAVCAIVVMMALVVLRWWWLRLEHLKVRSFSADFEERFNPERFEDEDDRIYSGRVISRLRSHLIEGRVEIHWEYRPEYIHRGYILSAKCRRNDGDWQPLAMEPFQDSGSWIECFNYGETRSYLFTVTKIYWFFFGVFGEQHDQIVYDQISFSVRKGKYLKEKKELIRDRRELLVEVKEYVKAEQEIRQLTSHREHSKAALPEKETTIQRLEKRRVARSELSQYLEEETAKINSRTDWSSERKMEEIQRLHEMLSEIALED